METYFSNLFEDIRYERSLILLLSLTNPDDLKQSKFTDDEINKAKNSCFRKITQTENVRRIFCFTVIGKTIF